MGIVKPLLLLLLLLLLLVTLSSGTEHSGERLIEDVVEGLSSGPEHNEEWIIEDVVERAAGSNAAVPAIFVFGDSVLDAGTNTLFPSLLQANFKPYGTQYFGKATGRFTDGRTYADFFATYIGLDLIEPYLKAKGKWSVITGVNYASAGSGLLRTSNAENKVIPFPDQILQFGETKAQIEQTLKSKDAAEQLFSKSLFLINIGANDIFGYIFNESVPQQVFIDGFNESVPQQVFIDGLLVILKASVGVLYGAGARKFMILGTGVLGCVPGALAAAGITNGQCVEAWSAVGEAYNTALEQFVQSLDESFPDIKAIIGTPYSQMQDFIINGEKYGFTAGLTACCGSGLYNAEVQCGRPADLVTNPPTNLCDDVSKHLFWDYYHPTDKAYEIMAKKFWSGNSSFVKPVNLRTLVSS